MQDFGHTRKNTLMAGPYINDGGYEVPDNTIVAVPCSPSHNGYYDEVIKPLKGESRREWFNEHYYNCLPIVIGNQYGFLVKSLRDFDVVWEGKSNNAHDLHIEFLNDDNKDKQEIIYQFQNGVITIQNYFHLKTPPGINLMTIQPPNMYIPGCAAMTGVVETDNVRRDFTFNLKVTVPNLKIQIRKGDPLAAFIPIQRGFVDKFEIKSVFDVFPRSLFFNEYYDMRSLGNERVVDDPHKPNGNGRRYFRGKHFDDSDYYNHQKRMD